MEFKIAGRHIDITPPIREYAQKKTQKLHRYYDRIQEISVVVSQADSAFDVEVIVEIEHQKPVVGRQHGSDVYACIDQVVDKVERQLTDVKEKLRNHKHVH